MELPIPYLTLDEDIYDDLLSDTDSEEEEEAEEVTEEAAKWKFIKPPAVQLNVNDIDTFLLAKARLGMARVTQRVMSRVFGTQDGHPYQVATVDAHINDNLVVMDFISTSDLLGFIEVELWLIFSGISPTAFYSKDNKNLYPPSKKW
ncbi:hypothetical protein PHMEG_00012311 [Phytophthora megakarya]|uniref:Uncharacterized protein n=1 Tax=Phytophthora megakarya TaxID=4795 RepID=A0A225WBN0_9STRA|nr:hypothetical protein PHMEG_00012311 [Phytophthora megakarya]